MSNMGVAIFNAEKNSYADHKGNKHSSAADDTGHCFWKLFSAQAIDQEAKQRQYRYQPDKLKNITHN